MTSKRQVVLQPAQASSFWSYLGCLALSITIVGAPFALAWGLWVYWSNRVHTWTLDSASLVERRGILTKKTDVLELFRVRDVQVVEPLWMRWFKIGTVIIHSNDKSHPVYELVGVVDPVKEALRIRTLAAAERQRHGVRAFEGEHQ